MASKGTLFLDEIGELHLDLQSKLLQVLEENSFERVGESASLKADIRLIAATNIDPVQSLKDGRLRSDLYYRLATMPMMVPMVEERRRLILQSATSLRSTRPKAPLDGEYSAMNCRLLPSSTMPSGTEHSRWILTKSTGERRCGPNSPMEYKAFVPQSR